MAVNRAEQALEKLLEKKIKQIEAELSALKTRQLLGGDNLVIGISNTITANLVINPGESVAINITVSNFAAQLTLILPAWSLFKFGVPSNDPSLLIPIGSAVTLAERRETRTEWREDLSTNIDSVGLKSFIFEIHNDGASTKTYYFEAKFYAPKVGLS